MQIQEKLSRVIGEARTKEEKLERIFYYVRDGITFDLLTDMFASPEDIIEAGRGACMNKALVLGTMAKEIGYNVRYHFMQVSKLALEDFLHPFVFLFYPKEFYHTFAELEINNHWIPMEPTFDKDLHAICLRRNLNFARYAKLRNLPIEFSLNGVVGAQKYHVVSGSEPLYDEDLYTLQRSMAEVPAFKRIIQPWAFAISSKWLNNKVRNL